jgi:hypothetical protein
MQNVDAEHRCPAAADGARSTDTERVVSDAKTLAAFNEPHLGQCSTAGLGTVRDARAKGLRTPLCGCWKGPSGDLIYGLDEAVRSRTELDLPDDGLSRYLGYRANDPAASRSQIESVGASGASSLRRGGSLALGEPVERCAVRGDHGEPIASKQMAFHVSVPSYKAVLEREALSNPVELAVIGDEEALAAAIEQYFDAGATEIIVTQTGMNGGEDRRRTWQILGELNRSRATAS